jgi:DNA primase catalytic core
MYRRASDDVVSAFQTDEKNLANKTEKGTTEKQISMIPEEIVDQIISTAKIEDIVQDFVKLKKRGSNYKGLCPFHTEKTPSFSVSPKKGMFKCFGCGKGGNAVSFVMEHEHMSYPEALKWLARKYSIKIPEKPLTDEQKKEYQHREALFKTNAFVAQFYQQQLGTSIAAKRYLLSRFSKEAIKVNQLGYAPEQWDALKKYAEKNQLKRELLMELGLLKNKKDGGVYDFFRGRVIIPIFNKYGKIVGFSARKMPGSNISGDAKYFNSKESDIYNKSEILFGIHLAHRSIRENDYVYLVEGNPDVLKLQSLDINNVLATSGTELTDEQIKQIANLTTNVTIIGDTDMAGHEATKKNAKKMIMQGFTISLILLPQEEDKKGNPVKHDADSYFTSHDQFISYKKENQTDFIIYYAKTKIESAGENTAQIKAAIKNVAEMVSSYPDKEMHEYYIEKLGSIKKPRKMWADKIKERAKEKSSLVKDQSTIPKDVSLSDFKRYGFYEDHNKYYFQKQNGVIIKGSNFKMRPLFHVESVINAKRLFEIKNEHGFTKTIELEQRDLITLNRFRERVESLGNFVWEAGEPELIKLKSFLYEKTDTCTEVMQLGWQPEGFFAWSNGIFNGKFQPVTKYGIATHDKKNFYIPAFSIIYENERQLYHFERQFRHESDQDLTLREITDKLTEVYGPNAKVVFAYYVATLFRDIIFRRFKKFPVLNLFGEKGAGKTECAISFLQFFGKLEAGIQINNATLPGLSDHVARVCNALVHIDEYRNDLLIDKIEFLKGLWNAVGRTRKNMDMGKKNEQTAVDAGVILTGQHMPTADVALYSRVLFVTFDKTEHTREEKRRLSELQKMQAQGWTHITNNILSYRETFKDNYYHHYKKVAKDLDARIDDEIESRIFENWIIIAASWATLEQYLDTDMEYESMMDLFAEKIKHQNAEIKTSNEIATFWNIVQYCAMEGLLKEGIDYKIKPLKEVKTDKGNIELGKKSRFVLIMNHNRVFPLYRKQGAQMKEEILPQDSIRHYLMNSKVFLGKKSSEAFLRPDHEHQDKKWRTTTAYVFDYERLTDLSLPNEWDNTTSDNSTVDLDGDNGREKAIDFGSKISYEDDDDAPF